MPLRVKCRCGQELVLRFNEWIYALFGFLVLSLLVNGTALVIILTRLGPHAGQGGAPASASVAPFDSSRSSALAGPAAGKADQGGPPPEAIPGAATVPPALASSAGPVEPPAAAGAVRAEPPEPGKSEPGKPERGAQAGAPAVPGLTLMSSGPPGGGLEPGRPPPDPPPSPESSGATPEARPRAARAERPPRLLLAGSTLPLERLLVAARLDDLRTLLLFVHDDDDVVRRFAVERALKLPLPPDAAQARKLLLLALPAAPVILNEKGGQQLLSRLAGEDHGPDPGSWREWARKTLGTEVNQAPPDDLLAPERARAEALRVSSPAAQSLEKQFGAGGAGSTGTDVLIALDVTESMEEPLRELSRRGGIFSALLWSVPDLRIGLLFYADEVVGLVPLGSDASTLARGFSSLKAEGGGDVPEGVHEALKAALQLGRFDWRPGAQKHIVFVGDGPPARAEVPPLLSLARECHREAGYRIHALSVNPPEGKAATLHFPEIAEAGGGRAATAEAARLAQEIVLTVFPEQAREELSRLLPALPGGALPGEAAASSKDAAHAR